MNIMEKKGIQTTKAIEEFKLVAKYAPITGWLDIS